MIFSINMQRTKFEPESINAKVLKTVPFIYKIIYKIAPAGLEPATL